ncbi:MULTISPECIES: RiPP maturation radical SAM C-methyltransferase [Actinoalloteichus]|uniref:Bacteriocin maturation radical SAM protein 1 n=1 Tax=Actinoalloteichus fjordicus TaxID=1612552 RepID=A0AAC9PSZ5_9PSEU|nr:MULTISPECIES: RiPP maturation radical SAM C-methyltransferase [Actinoalloteichus]APU15560.1 bacteriocin maturation radical SAM protein 1 [Actinoalloteichus fjordicus]APU21627.1 bacteriocin maturation radical SAM protein 1 [Actinoalloteichus sp. GBA129-24]
MRVLLVNMPWALIDVPSLALGILRRAAIKADPAVEVDVLHANLDYVDWVTQRSEFTIQDYHFYSLATYFAGVGDWVFSSALYDDPQWRNAEFVEQVPMTDEHRRMSLELHASAPDFVAELTERILAMEPDLVGFTSTFQQNMPTLAVARAIKRAAPHVLTAMGGANCDGVQGEALHRNYEFLDFVIRGEGEVTFPRLLAALRQDTAPSDVLGLCWRGPDGISVSNRMNTRPLMPAEIVSPDYDGYFERLDVSTARDWVEPKLVVEGARGCWWGEKHHCKFCGLNGSFMEFRSKSPTVFWAEIVELVTRHQVLDMFVVDNILDMGYVKTLLPTIIDSGYDLRMQYEIKSNMRRGQLETLFKAGLVNVQPGIESLNSRVLKLMDKGVTGCQNVRMLRDAATVGLSIAWNYLYGFPGEDEADYLPVIEQMPALHHLPPLDGVARIVIERFSPYFNRPELGFGELTPGGAYTLSYDLPESELLDLAYLFSSPERGIDESLGDRLRAAADRWQREFAGSRLSHTDLGSEILLISRRRDFDWSTLRLTDPWDVAVFRLLDQPHTLAALDRKLSADGGASDVGRLERLTRRWLDLGILFTESEHYVHVAPLSTNQDLMRIDTSDPVEETSMAGASA